MSVRRVDDDYGNDDGGYAPSSIGAPIGTFANRLPGATRLSHVLAIGAKFKQEQRGKQQPSQRKMVSTDAYPRAGMYAPDPQDRPYDYVSYSRWGQTIMGTCKFDPTALYTQHFNVYRAAIDAFGENPGNPILQWDAMRATMALAAISTSLKKIDYLREKDCYIVLNFMVNAMNADTLGHRAASFMMRESLHHDKLVPTSKQPITRQDIANRVINQCTLSNVHLAPLNAKFAYNPANYPAMIDAAKAQREMDWEVCEQDAKNAERAAEEEEAAAAAAAAAAAEAEAHQNAAMNAAAPSWMHGHNPGNYDHWGNPSVQY
jgi:hypothetical protein